MIILTWYEQILIIKEMIIKPFKKTVIFNKMDGSEDDTFERPEEITKDFDFSQIELDK